MSFNKFTDIIKLIKLFSINSYWNNNLEIINVIGNTFFNSNKNKELFYLLIKRFCPSIKYINNDEIKKNKIRIIPFCSTPVNYINLNCNLNESYTSIFNSENLFMKYFTSVYFTNNIFNVYNININNNLRSTNLELFLLINQAYFQFKLSHFISQTKIVNLNIGFFSYENKFQFNELLEYLYKFKNRMLYITNSIPILVKRTLFRRMKIIKIQQQYKLRILRKKLAAIVIPDDEDDHAEDLLEFFNSTKKEKEENLDIDFGLDKKMKEIELNIEKNIKNNKSKSKFNVLEIIREEDKDIENQFNQQEKIDINKKNDNKILNKKNTFNINKIKEGNIKKEINENISINKDIKNNPNSINDNPKKETFLSNENHKEKDSLVMKLLSNPKYNSNNKLNPIRLTPITKDINNIQSSTNKNYINNPNNNQNIEMLKRGLGIIPKNSHIILDSYNENYKTRYPNPNQIKLKDEINYGKVYDINNQINLPSNIPQNPSTLSGRKSGKYLLVKRPESKGVILPKIPNNNTNNLNASTTTFSNETYSVHSQLTNNKQFLKITQNKGKMFKKTDEVALLEKECKEAIEKAKAEWKFTNKNVEDILVKKIKKNYRKKINAILNKYG